MLSLLSFEGVKSTNEDSHSKSLKHFELNTIQQRTWKYENSLLLTFITAEKVIKEIHYPRYDENQENS